VGVGVQGSGEAGNEESSSVRKDCDDDCGGVWWAGVAVFEDDETWSPDGCVEGPEVDPIDDDPDGDAGAGDPRKRIPERCGWDPVRMVRL
jgi:hypothetical protein